MVFVSIKTIVAQFLVPLVLNDSLQMTVKLYNKNMDTTFTLDQLSALTDLSLRTIRYYIQLGLVERHEGDRKHARYTQRHLDQLLQVRGMADQGMPLERIKHQMQGTTPPLPPPRAAGDISVISKVFIAPGVELHLEPQAAGLPPEKLRQFVRAVLNQWEILHDPE
jgi:DNA-binding transcriptional MerR regulator